MVHQHSLAWDQLATVWSLFFIDGQKGPFIQGMLYFIIIWKKGLTDLGIVVD